MVSAVLKDLLRRRVPQLFGVYLAAGWAVLEFTDFLVNRYILSPHLIDLALVAWALLAPTVLLLAYFHGAPGRDRWTRVEKIAIPLNFAVAAVALYAGFAHKDLGAATAAVTLETEAGDTVQRVVPKREFRKSLVIFYFDNRSGDSDLDYLQIGIPFALQFDLQQDLFLDIRFDDSFRERLQLEGYEDGLNTPLALKRDIAEFLHLGHFVTGTIAAGSSKDSLVVRALLYETRSGKLLQERRYAGAEIFDLLDEISEQLRRDLGLPDYHIEENRDLPVSEMLTDSEAAYRAYIAGWSAAQLERDWQEAGWHFRRAVSADPSFARARLAEFETYLNLNDVANAEAALEATMDLLYKLPERQQFGIKSVYYWLYKTDIDKAQAAAEMHVELFPQDVAAHENLSRFLTMRGDNDAAIAELKRARELDPSRVDLLRTIGELFEKQGARDSARVYYERHAAQAANDPDAYVVLGTFLENIGDHEEARRQFERGLVVDPGSVRALTSLGDLDRHLGSFDRSLETYHDALAAATSAAQRAEAYDGLMSYYRFRGQPRRAIQYMHLSWAEQDTYRSPFEMLQERLNELSVYVEAGLAETALDTMSSIAAQLEPPFDLLVPFGYLNIYLELENPDSIVAYLPGLERLIEGFGLEELRAFGLYVRGRTFEWRGECQEALHAFRRGLQLQPQSLGFHVDLGRCNRKLGRLDEAIASLDRVLQIYPHLPDAHYEMALVYKGMGDPQRAMDHLLTALRVWEDAEPEFAPARDARSTLAEWRANL